LLLQYKLPFYLQPSFQGVLTLSVCPIQRQIAKMSFIFGNNNSFGSRVSFGNRGSSKVGAVDGVTTMFINNQQIEVPGVVNSIEARDDGIWINGKLLKDTEKSVLHVTINIQGSVQGPVSTGSGNINITGDVTGDVDASSGTIKIGKGAGGSVTSSSGDITIGGNTGSHIQTSSGDVRVQGSVTGNVKTSSGDIYRR